LFGQLLLARRTQPQIHAGRAKHLQWADAIGKQFDCYHHLAADDQSGLASSVRRQSQVGRWSLSVCASAQLGKLRRPGHTNRQCQDIKWHQTLSSALNFYSKTVSSLQCPVSAFRPPNDAAQRCHFPHFTFRILSTFHFPLSTFYFRPSRIGRLFAAAAH